MSDARSSVLYLAPWVDLGGSDKGTIDWFRHLDQASWRPSLITTQSSLNRRLHEVEPFAEELWNLPDLLPGRDHPDFILGFIESRDVRVVHLTNSRLGFDLVPDIAGLRRPPAIVVQLHAEEPGGAGYVRYVATRFANLIDCFSVTSQPLADALAAYDVPVSRIEVIHTGIDAAAEFDPERVLPLDPGSDGHSILWVGRLTAQEDPLLAVRVARGLADRGVRFTLHLVGDGELEAPVRALVDELGMTERVRLHPASWEVARWYRSADVLLMTSAYEGIPYAVFEALAMATPVVAPALPGNRELVDRDAGLLIEPGADADRYAAALEQILEDGDERVRMGAVSRQRMLGDFGIDAMARAHEELYGRLGAALPDSGHAEGALSAEPAPEPVRLYRDPAPERTVAVVIPCNRHGRYLGESVESVRAQTLSAAEIVVVDDGSPDAETHAALDALEAAPDITMIRLKESGGPSAARNRGIAAARSRYVLPLDADDRLLPDAIERMVATLEGCPPDVAFVYPNPKHFGNRSDYAEVPEYNLWLLMENSYIASACLFDRGAFDAGVRYPEDLALGHEDWHLVLHLAERGLRGMVMEGPTFLYRRAGFSRIDVVWRRGEFRRELARRHPQLYTRREVVKARWAPALSVLLMPGAAPGWDGAHLTALGEQSCRDLEVIAGPEAGGEEAGLMLRTVGEDSGETAPHAWLADALDGARGRFVLVCGRGAAPLLGRRALAELTIRALESNELGGIVFAEAPDRPRAGLALIGADSLDQARPHAVAWGRPLERALAGHTPRVARLGADPMRDLVLAVQLGGPLQWRAVGAGRAHA